MSEVLEFFKAFNVQTIMSMAVMMWYFSRYLGDKIDALDKDIREMNKRTSRLEGTVYGKDLYKQE